ncbi:hypothetical protein ABH920_004721 [Catenulispora sp. EB89]
MKVRWSTAGLCAELGPSAVRECDGSDRSVYSAMPRVSRTSVMKVR